MSGKEKKTWALTDSSNDSSFRTDDSVTEENLMNKSMLTSRFSARNNKKEVVVDVAELDHTLTGDLES